MEIRQWTESVLLLKKDMILTSGAILGIANAGANNPHLVGRGEATVEIEDDRFGHWPLALDFEKLSHDGKSKGRSKATERAS